MNKDQPEDDEHTIGAPLIAEPESFGPWLRRQREARDIELREIADSSKVSMTYLRALEEDRFEVLPAPVFAKGFLRQYAQYVGLDCEEVVNFYLAARHPEGEEEPSLEQRTAPEPPARNFALIAFALVTATLVLLVWVLSIFSDRARSESVPSPAPKSRELPAGDEAEPRSAGAGSAEVESSAEPPAADPQRAEPTVQEPAWPLRVTLDFISDCWVETSVDGERKLSELKVQGESLLLDAKQAVELKIGNVDAVQVEVNGFPFEIEHRAGTSVRTIRIDLETLAAKARGEHPAPAQAPAAAADGR